MTNPQTAEGHRYVHFQLPTDQYEALKALSERENRSVSAQLRHLVQMATREGSAVSGEERAP